jgi:hypothetical protein
MRLPFLGLPGLLLLGAPLSAAAATEVCGTLRVIQEWTPKGSPYIVTGDVYFPNTSTLRILPGTVVRFAKPGKKCEAEDPAPAPEDWADSAYTGLRVEGPFQCLGTEEAPIVFENEGFRKGTVGWDGIRIAGQSAANAQIGFAVFRGAHNALRIRKADFSVHHSLFEGNNTGMVLEGRGDVNVVNCAFLDNLSAGISIEKARPRLAANVFAGNRGYGIWGDGRLGLYVGYNAFWDNREEHCYRCPHFVLAGAKDTVPDAEGNRIADPVFEGSESHKAAQRADVDTDTPEHLVKDKEVAKMEAANRKKWAKEKAAFKPQGTGPYRLSAYSSLRDAGPPGTGFKDRDGSRNDIGLHGGPMGRLAEDPF